MARVGIVQFPGSNCEYETARAAKAVGFDAQIVRWNAEVADSFDAYILPGGFSYQDRVRAGAISSKLPVIADVVAAAKDGRPVLGICNGCQILAETGLIPDLGGEGQVDVGLAKNQVNEMPHGFVCDWVFVKVENPEKSLFTRAFSASDVLPIPVNHGEGRFVFSPGVLEQVTGFTQFKYASVSGEVEAAYPVTPNGSTAAMAGLCNEAGNVLAIMPHPERATFVKQVPQSIEGPWPAKKQAAFASNDDTDGPWIPLFRSMFEAVS